MKLGKQNNDAVQQVAEVLAKHNYDISSPEIPAQIIEKIPVENYVENIKSIEEEIVDILPGPEPKKKPEPDNIRYFESDFGNIEWNVNKKIITFDNGVVFTEQEILILHKEQQGRKLTAEEWNLKTSFKGKFVEPEMEFLNAKAS